MCESRFSLQSHEGRLLIVLILSALPWVLSIKPAKYEVDRMAGFQDMLITYRQTEIPRFYRYICSELCSHQPAASGSCAVKRL